MTKPISPEKVAEARRIISDAIQMFMETKSQEVASVQFTSKTIAEGMEAVIAHKNRIVEMFGKEIETLVTQATATARKEVAEEILGDWDRAIFYSEDMKKGKLDQQVMANHLNGTKERYHLTDEGEEEL